MSRIRAAIASLLFLVVLIGGYRCEYFRFLKRDGLVRPAGPSHGIDRRPLRESLDPGPAEFQAFLKEVAQRTRRGDSIALVVPDEMSGFSYAYYQASYALAGRRLISPLRLKKTEYIAAWNREALLPDHVPVWVGHGGTLLRSAR